MSDADLLKQWFLEKKRDLPWRKLLDPYAVWVSEVMLQQTQVSTVIPYFERWLKAFPSVEALANAKEEKVIKLWEGLGYYSRARALHKGAKEIMSRFKGKIPSEEKALLSLPGIGPYTAAAILSFAFHKRALAIDGNVLRVLSRYFGIYGEVSRPQVRSKISEKGSALLCDAEPWKSAEALIELGALVCKKQVPVCGECPLKEGCYAYAKEAQSALPEVKKRKKTVFLHRIVPIIRHKGSILVSRPAASGLMQGLYEFPFIEVDSSQKISPLIVEKWLEELGLQGKYVEVLKEQSHTFTHHRARLYPYLFELNEFASIEAHKGVKSAFWVSENALLSLAFSSGHRRVLFDLQSFLETYVH